MAGPAELILSYIFIGVVPALLIIAFFILGAWVVSINVSASTSSATATTTS